MNKNHYHPSAKCFTGKSNRVTKINCCSCCLCGHYLVDISPGGPVSFTCQTTTDTTFHVFCVQAQGPDRNLQPTRNRINDILQSVKRKQFRIQTLL